MFGRSDIAFLVGLTWPLPALRASAFRRSSRRRSRNPLATSTGPPGFSTSSPCAAGSELRAGLSTTCLNHKHVMCCEIDPVLQGHLKHHFEPQYMVTDALTTKFINTPPPEFKGKIHLLVGGFPCQPFAGLGLHQGFNDEAGRGHVIHHIIKWIKKHEPRSFVLENVSGLLYPHKEEFCIILKALKNLGKWRVSWKLINSSDHGVAQEPWVRKIMPGS